MADKPKSEVAKSEFWIVAIGSAGSLLSALTTTHPGAGKWISFAGLIATTIVYAIMRTPLASDHPGWKTKSFWASLAIVLASVAAAVTEANVPGLPPGVTKVGSIIVTVLTALGYAAIRVGVKNSTDDGGVPSDGNPPADPPAEPPKTA